MTREEAEKICERCAFLDVDQIYAYLGSLCWSRIKIREPSYADAVEIYYLMGKGDSAVDFVMGLSG